MKETIQECEQPALEGDSRFCATSLESLVDFSIRAWEEHQSNLKWGWNGEPGIQTWSGSEGGCRQISGVP